MPKLRKKEFEEWHAKILAFDEDYSPHDPEGLACITLDGRQYTRRHLLTLIKGGASNWNEWKASLPASHWRYRYTSWLPGYVAKMHAADLRRTKLSRANLSGIDWTGSKFTQAKLREIVCDMSANGTFERHPIFDQCDFRSADLTVARLNGASIKFANLNRAELNGTFLGRADLSHSTLYKALVAARFRETKLENTNFEGAHIWLSSFVETDLTKASNLDRAEYYGQSSIDTETLRKSFSVSRQFFRGCGVDETLIEYLPSMFEGAIQMYTCFISYSAKDKKFADRLYKDLQAAGVRCWYAPQDLPIGARIRDGIDQAVKLHDKVILVLSKNSIESHWVEQEVESAYERERNENSEVLLPIMIDNSVMKHDRAWSSHLRRSRNIGDFKRWKNLDTYEEELEKLLSSVRLP